MVKIGRPINGVTINGLEWLCDENNSLMLFPSVQSAMQYLREHGYADLSDGEMHEHFVFEMNMIVHLN